MLSQITRLFEHSLDSLHTPSEPDDQDFEKRRAEILALASRPKKVGALLVHEFVGWQPEASKNIQDRLLGMRHIQRAGRGCTAEVFRMNQDVLKVYFRTYKQQDEERAKFIKDEERKISKLASLLGGVVVPHDYSIGAHPITDRRAVIARQDFVSFLPEDSIFDDFESAVDPVRIAAIEQRHPGATEALSSFAYLSLDAFHENSYLPDIYGPDNLVIGSRAGASPGLHLIDSVPHRLYTSDPAACDHIVDQLYDLAALPRAA